MRWLAKSDIAGQVAFIAGRFGLTAAALIARTNQISRSDFQFCNTSSSGNLV